MIKTYISKQTSCKTEWEIKNGLSRHSFGHNADLTCLGMPSSGTLIIKKIGKPNNYLELSKPKGFVFGDWS